MSDEGSLPLEPARAEGHLAWELEEDRHWWFASRTAALLGILDRFLEPGKRPVLDVGCGAGNMFHHLRRYGPVVGVDPNPRPLAVARQRGYDVQQGSAEAIPWGDHSFGLVALLQAGGMAHRHHTRLHVVVEPQRRAECPLSPLHRAGIGG